MKIAKAITSVFLTLTIIFSGINVMAVTIEEDLSSNEQNVSFDTSKKYYIYLKEESNDSDDPLSELRQLRYRWNINGGGGTFNAVVHLDEPSGDNCEMVFQSAGNGYYGIHYEGSGYWIDVEHDSSEVGNVLHQYHNGDLSRDNQQFRFVPVDGEEDTYYIISKKTDQAGNGLYVGTLDNEIAKHTKIALTSKSTKWVIKPTDEPLTTGEEVQLYGSKNGVSDPAAGAPVFTLNPEGYIRNVSVNNTGSTIVGVPNGNCLQLYNIGSTSKISAEWIESEQAYRLRSYYNWEENMNFTNVMFPQDLVWDIDGESIDDGAVAHVWQNQGNDHESQLWRFIPVEGKSDIYYIYNVNSKLYLSLEEQNDEDEVKLIQSTQKLGWELQILNQNGVHAYTEESVDYSINAGNWMSKLPDDMYLSEVNMPGTHDAGAARMLLPAGQALSATLCHQLYLDEQLNAGVRVWDIRIDRASAKTEEDPNIIHGMSAIICRNKNGNVLELEEVMNTARDFLETHSGETIVMTLKGDGKTVGSDEDVADQVLKYIKDESYPIYKPSSNDEIPTLGEVRGKIVFIRRLDLSSEYKAQLETDSAGLSYSLLNAFGIDGSKWDDNDYSSYKYAQQVGQSKLYVQDNYSEDDSTTKLQYFTGTIENATDNKLTAGGANYLFNYSAAKDNIRQPREINLLLMTEDLLNQPATDSERKTIGYVMTNYIDAKLAERIYMTNFYSDHVHQYNENGFCTICDQYQPAVLNSDGVYEISNAGQLYWFASLVNGDSTHADFDSQNSAANAVLVKDIVVNDGEVSAQSSAVREWTPIGTQDDSYTGQFDGQRHTISGLYFNDSSADNVGLFGYTRGGADIYNVGLINSYFAGNYGVGGILGRNNNSGVTVQRCFSEATVVGNQGVGGIVGSTYGGRIYNCYNAGSVTGFVYVGSIRGQNTYTGNGAINNCFNVGSVVGTGDDNIGGIRGDGNGLISNCYCIDTQLTDTSAITKTPEQFASGEVAYLLNNKVTDGTQVWYQNIDNGETPDDYPVFEGGTVYYLSYKDAYSNTYSEPDAFDRDDDGNFIIRTYDDLVTLSNLIRSDYEAYGSQSYILENNIIAPADSQWIQGIGSAADNKPFNGSFDGNGYCIIGLNVGCAEYGGLFEIIGESGAVKDLMVFKCSFTASSQTAGGVAAVNNGTIDHCISGVNFTTGTIHYNGLSIEAASLNSNIKGEISGGIAGENNGAITGCRNASVITGTQCGGIAGANTGTIYGCVNNAKIGTSSSQISGGLAGSNSGIIESSYNSGAVSAGSESTTGSIAGLNDSLTITNVFYSTISGLSAVGSDSTQMPDITNNGISKSTDFMTESFVDELNSVSDDTVIWVHNSILNKGYPSIKGNFLKYSVKSAGNNITVAGSMHEDLQVGYSPCAEDSAVYNALTSKLGGRNILSMYEVSLSDRNGNYIPAELWCQGELKLTVPVDSEKVQLAVLDADGQLTYYEPESVKDGIAVFTVAEPASFALVDNEDNNTQTVTDDNAQDNTEKDSVSGNNGKAVNTGDVAYPVIILLALASLTFIIVLRRRNNIG